MLHGKHQGAQSQTPDMRVWIVLIGPGRDQDTRMGLSSALMPQNTQVRSQATARVPW